MPAENKCNIERGCVNMAEIVLLEAEVKRCKEELKELQKSDKEQEIKLAGIITKLYIGGTAITIVMGAFVSYLFNFVK